MVTSIKSTASKSNEATMSKLEQAQQWMLLLRGHAVLSVS